MDNLNDNECIARFLGGERENSFRTLVDRHSAMVYGCARRIVGSHELAQDVSQAVFLLLLQKASTLKHYSSIAGWLYRCTSFMARDALKLARRREARELENGHPGSEESSWIEVSTHLDACMESLSESDRHALLLRFFENQSLRQVGAALGLSEDTAQKRLTRALEKLRQSLLRRGIVMSTITLGALVSAHAAGAVPAATQALLAGVMTSTVPPTPWVTSVLKSTLQDLFMTKLKMAAATTLTLLLFTGGIGYYLANTQSAVSSAQNVSDPNPIQILATLAEAARTHDGAAIASMVHVTGDDRRQRLQALTDWITAIGKFDRACRKAFGDNATETALWKSSPSILYRLDFGQKNLASANMQMVGQEAQVNIRRESNVWQFIRFLRVDGAWKIHEEAIDDVASPSDARKYAKLTPILNSFTTRVSSDSISSADVAMQQFRPLAMQIYSE